MYKRHSHSLGFVCAIGFLVGAVFGAAMFGTIAAVAHGGWSTTEATVIGFWLMGCLGAFFSFIGNVS
jgi:hypothetical protein